MNVDSDKPRRRWLHFRLRTLLIVVTVLSIPLSWVAWNLEQVRRERPTIAWIEEVGGEVEFGYGYQPDEISWWKKKKDKWFGERVQWASLLGTQVSDVSPLAERKNLEELWLDGTQVSDISTRRSGRDAELVRSDPRPHREVGAAATGGRSVQRVGV